MAVAVLVVAISVVVSVVVLELNYVEGMFCILLLFAQVKLT